MQIFRILFTVKMGREMINIAAFIGKYLGEKALENLLSFLKGNKSELQIKFDEAFENTVHWYEKKYNKKYGSKNERFFDYQAAQNELTKLIFLKAEPNFEIISQIELIEGKNAPQKVILDFVNKLREELSQIRECDEILMEKEIYFASKNTEEHTASMDNTLKNIDKKLGKIVEPEENKPVKPLDWRKLKAAFERRKLHLISIKSIGAGLEGPENLNLDEVFFEQDGGVRSIDFFMDSATSLDEKGIALKSGFWESLDAQLWHWAQEHRNFFPGEAGIDEDKEEKALATIEKIAISKFARKGIGTADFNELIEDAAERLEKSPAQIVQLLKRRLQSTMIRKPIFELIDPPNTALIVGDAGVGKTTLMRKLSLDLFSQLDKNEKEKNPVPLFVRLDQIADFMKEDQPLNDAEESLFRYICEHWKSNLDFAEDLTQENLQNCPRPIQLILDGLDEIPSANLRDKLAHVLNNLSQNRNMQIIITSRPAAITESFLNTLKFEQIKLLELKPEQIAKFVRNFFDTYHRKDQKSSREDSKAFLDALQLSETAQEFSGNPLYLTVMILMHKKHEVLPRKRIELFAEFYEMLLVHRSLESDAKKRGDKPIFEMAIAKAEPIIWHETVYTKLLQEMAYLAHKDEDDSVSISRDRVIQAIESQRLDTEFKERAAAKDVADYFIDFADETLGVLVKRGMYWGFSHRSLQEYLTARRLAEFDEKGEIMDFWEKIALKKPDRWAEVARLLFCEIRGKRFLIEYLEAQFPRNIADTDDERIINMISGIMFDLEEFFKGGGIKNLHTNVAKAFASRRDKAHEKPSFFIACSDALGKMNEPEIDVADPPMVFFDMGEREFEMGSDEGDDDEVPVHPVNLSPFWLGVYPVTNKEFAEFMRDGGYENEEFWHFEHPRFGFDGRKFLKELKERMPRLWLDEEFGKSRPLAPVVGVSWYEAMAYCRWWTIRFANNRPKQNDIDGEIIMRLPTEAEWEFAAAGFEKRRFAWGNEAPTRELANYGGNLIKTTTVGSFARGKTPDDLFDMSGNVWEWCLDWFDDNYYRRSLKINPLNLNEGDLRVVRGGSWHSNVRYLRCAFRFRLDPSNRVDYVGFRCSRAYL